MGYPPELLTDDEHILAEFRSHWRVLLPPIFLALLAASLAVVAVIYLPTDLLPWAKTVVWAPGLALVIIGLTGVRPVVAWWFSYYVLTDERIIVRSSLIARRSTEIPLENIHNVVFSQSIMERILGYGDITLESAGPTGRSEFVDIPNPENFQRDIYAAREDRTKVLQRGGYGLGQPHYDQGPTPPAPGGGNGWDDNTSQQDTAAADSTQRRSGYALEEQLNLLFDMRASGVIDDEAFAAQQKKLLDGHQDSRRAQPADVADTGGYPDPEGDSPWA